MGTFITMAFLTLLAIPSFIARAGFGRRVAWFGASAGFLISFLVLHLWRHQTEHFFHVDTEDFNGVAMVDVLFAYVAIALAIAGCFWRQRSK
jgi:heme/copper-type cytochrome/quinol oxidase subunit 4